MRQADHPLHQEGHHLEVILDSHTLGSAHSNQERVQISEHAIHFFFLLSETLDLFVN